MKFKNSYSEWVDKDTFQLVFDGETETDEDGDRYWYNCEYWKDEDRWIFIKMWEDDYVEANWSAEQKEMIKNYMKSLM